MAVLETGNTREVIDDTVCAFVEIAAACLHENAPTQTSVVLGGWTAALYGACEVCPGGFPCRRFASTAYRPEVCMCSHGAAHHVAIHPRMVHVTGGECTPLEEKIHVCKQGSNLCPLRNYIPGSRAKFVEPALWSGVVKLLQHGAHFFSSIGPAGVRDVLGLKRTAGSIEGRLPPSRRTLLASLNKPHVVLATTKQPQTEQGRNHVGCKQPREGPTKTARISTLLCNLTVGGRAICKHCGRGEDGWWGNCGGTEADKNDSAEQVVLLILATATWANLHAFGGGGGDGQDGVFEVREALGYGARWSADGSVFRGFLEPHMEDGHEKGWRH